MKRGSGGRGCASNVRWSMCSDVISGIIYAIALGQVAYVQWEPGVLIVTFHHYQNSSIPYVRISKPCEYNHKLFFNKYSWN